MIAIALPNSATVAVIAALWLAGATALAWCWYRLNRWGRTTDD